MRKFDKYSNLQYSLDKQYKSTLVLLKLVAQLSVEITELNSKVEQQEKLINSLVAGLKLEEDPV